jgi:ATP-binding cassette subfamily C protein CydCD
VAGVGVGSGTAVLVVLQARFLATAVSGVFDTHRLDGLGSIMAGLAAVLIGRGVLSWLNAWLAQRTAAAVKSQLRTDILAARLAAPSEATSTSSALVTLVTQGLDALDGYFSKYLPQLLLAVTVPLIVGVAILMADFDAALIIAVTIPFIPLLMALVGFSTQDRVAKRWAFQTRLANHFADLVAGLPTLQVFSRAKAQAAGLRRTEAANRQATLGILKISFLSALVLELFSTLAVAVVAVTIGTRLCYGGLSFETALFVLILAPEVYLPIRQVGTHYHDSADGLAAAEAAFAEIDGSHPMTPQPGGRPPADPSIRAEGLTYTYPGTDRPALAPIDLSVGPGEVVALSGRSGGGKSTLLKLVLGFLPLTGGRLQVGGVSVADVDLDAWRRLVAYVPQTPGLIEGTVADNVRLGQPGASDSDVRSALDLASAPSLALERLVNDTGEGLSVGERRRVGVARALLRIRVGGARLLLLDEPTAGLDTDAETAVLASLRASGAAALVVSHRAAVVAASDRVVEVTPAALGPAAETAPALTDSAPGEGGSAVVEAASNRPPTASGADPDGAVGVARSSGFFIDFEDPTAKPRAEEAEIPHHRRHGRVARSALSRLVLGLLDAVPNGRLRLVAAILLAAGASGASVALMGVSAWLISRAAEHPNFLELTVAAVGVRTFAIARAVLRYVERLVGHDVALRMQTALRLRTYGRLARTTLLGRARGDLLVRIVADVGAIEDVVVRIVIPFAAAGAVVLGTFILVARFSLAAATVLLVSAVLGGLVIPLLTQRASLTADAAAVPLRGALGTLVHSLARTAPDLAAYGVADQALARLREVDGRLRDVEARAAWVQGVGAGLQVVAAGLAVLGGLWCGAVAVADGSLGGRLLAVLVLTPLALHEVFANFAQAAQTVTRAGAALDRVVAILDAPPVGQGDAPVAADEQAAALHLRSVSIGWPGHDVIAEGIDLDLIGGQSVAVVGPSGVGKTTLAATVMGLIPARAGTVEVGGRIGYLAQDAHIFATSIAENVRIGNKDATTDEVRAALHQAGLDLDPNRVVGELGSTLSGGEARRLALARLFVGPYHLLILDEPTEHLDRETADALMDDIWARLDRRPVLVVSHDESLAARCDRVLDLAVSAGVAARA